MNTNAMTKQEIEESLIAKAWQDNSFKQELLSNPKSVLQREGIILPEGVDIKVLEESISSFYLIIPTPPSSSGELSEADLESVAGGKWCLCKDK
jgi:hypothetical protein